jgi:hypothetical protein
LIVINLVIGISFYRYVIINKIIRHDKELDCQRIAKIFSNLVLNDDQDFIEVLTKDSRSTTFPTESVQNSLKFFNSLDVEKITLYNNSYSKLLSSNDKNFNYSNKKTFSLNNLFSSFDNFLSGFLDNLELIQSDIIKWKIGSIILNPITSEENLGVKTS